MKFKSFYHVNTNGPDIQKRVYRVENAKVEKIEGSGRWRLMYSEYNYEYVWDNFKDAKTWLINWHKANCRWAKKSLAEAKKISRAKKSP